MFSSLFDVGLLFVLVGGLLYLTLSGRLINMFRDRAPKPLLAIAAVVGLAIYHWSSMGPDSASGPEAVAPESASEVPPPPVAPSAPKAAAVKRRPKVENAPAAAPVAQPESTHWKTVIVEDVPATQVVVPTAAEPVKAAAAAPAAGPDPYESKAKRAVKAVGRFFRYRKSDP
jgi:hypothetical protein